MVDESEIRNRTPEVITLIRWWYSRNPLRYSQVMRHGGTKDFISDVWLRMVRSLKNTKQVECSLCTMVCWACKWELGKHQHKASIPLHTALHAGRFTGRQFRGLVAVEETHGTESHSEAIELWTKIRSRLTQRQYGMVFMWSGISGTEFTHGQIGVKYGVSHSRVGQIIRKALRRLVSHGVIDGPGLLSSRKLLTKTTTTNKWKSDAAQVLLSELMK